MNTPLKILAASAFLVAPTLAAAADTCQPRVIDSPTHFPMRAQLRGQEGIVYVDVEIDANGRATRTTLQRSSGYRLLDRAARQSIVNWRFDVSDCLGNGAPSTHRVAIDYRNSDGFNATAVSVALRR